MRRTQLKRYITGALSYRFIQLWHCGVVYASGVKGQQVFHADPLDHRSDQFSALFSEQRDLKLGRIWTSFINTLNFAVVVAVMLPSSEIKKNTQL